MKKWWLLPLFLLVFGAVHAGNLVGLSPDELQTMQENGALVVDVRTPQEWRNTGFIPGSKGLTYFDSNGGYDKDTWLKQLRAWLKSPQQPVILVCRSGNRSAMVGRMLVDEAGFAKAYHLEKGIRAWSSESRPLAVQ